MEISNRKLKIYALILVIMIIVGLIIHHLGYTIGITFIEKKMDEEKKTYSYK